MAKRKVKVMTWNIWAGKNWKEVVKVIKENQVDVVGFQEVAHNLESAHNIAICNTIAKDLNFYPAFCESVKYSEHSSFGNCTVSRFPVVESKRHFLSSEVHLKEKRSEPRTMLETTLQIEDKLVKFFNLHLDYSIDFVPSIVRFEQIKKALEVIKHEKLPVILVGDFNALPHDEDINEVKKHLKDVDPYNELNTWTNYEFEFENITIPAGLKYKLDYIFISKKLEHEKPKVINSLASDHAPITVEILI